MLKAFHAEGVSRKVASFRLLTLRKNLSLTYPLLKLADYKVISAPPIPGGLSRGVADISLPIVAEPFFGLDCVTFRRGVRPILKDATLRLPASGAICLFGPSGCGKTTVLHLLAGLLEPESGQVRVPGPVAMAFQEDRLLPWLDALDNVRFPPGVERAQAEKALERLGIGEMRKPVTGLSGGQRARVAIARATLAPCALLLLDEPFRGLDEAAREVAADLIRERAAVVPCVLVAHDRAEAALLGAKLVPMTSDGTIGVAQD